MIISAAGPASPTSCDSKPSMTGVSPRPISILILDSQALVRTGLHSFLDTQPDFQVIAGVGDAIDALSTAAQTEPDIILFEPNSIDRSSLDLVPHLLDAALSAKIILVTSIQDPEFHSRAASLGVMGVVS